MPSLSQWMARFIEWLNKQETGTQGLVLAIVALLLGFAWPTTSWVLRNAAQALTSRRQRRVREADALKASKETERLQFESFPADLGIVDHGVNLHASMEAMMELLHRTSISVASIMTCLLKDTPSKFPDRGDPNGANKKQQVLKAAAETLRTHVLALEDIAKQLKSHAETLFAAHRSMFALPIESDGDRQALRDLKSLYSGSVAEAFRQGAEVVHLRQRDIAKFQGKQQDLKRVVIRTTAALERIVGTTRGVYKFCSREIPMTVDRLLRPDRV